MITTELLIILALLMLNAFFALSEMAVVSSSKPMLRHMAKQGNRRAAAALKLAEDSGRFLSTVQVGITLVGILAGAYGGAEIADKLAPYLDDVAFIGKNGELVAVVLVVASITYLSVVVGELVPKQFALSRPEKMAMFIAPFMTVLSRICTPVVITLEMSAAVVLRLLRIQTGAEQVTEAEVKAMLAEGVASGAIEKNEHEMLQRIIRLGDRDVKSVMTPRVDVTFIDLADNMEAIRRKVNKAGHSRYPAIEGGDTTKVMGVLRAKELLDAALDQARPFQLRDHLREIPALLETTKCLNALELFKTSSTHIAVVVDEYGSMQGIVTASDMLEAIVGVMRSNYGADEEPFIIQREDGSWLVDGATSIDEIHLSIGIEEIDANGDYGTIAGFILDVLGHTPATGQAVTRYGYRFEVVDMDGLRIDKVLVSSEEQEEA